MAKKFNADIVSSVLRQQGLTDEQVQNAIAEMRRITEQEEANTASPEPRVKMKPVVVMQGLPEDFNPAICSVWIIKVPETEDVTSTTVGNHVGKVAYNYNEVVSRKSAQLRVRNFAETMEFVQAKYFKTEGIQRVTKEPVEVVKIDNNLQIIKEVDVQDITEQASE